MNSKLSIALPTLQFTIYMKDRVVVCFKKVRFLSVYPKILSES